MLEKVPTIYDFMIAEGLNDSEKSAIKDKAMQDGTFMKNTKLDEDQWLTVRTQAFKNWFGDWEDDPENASKVIDNETGEPLVLYHGTEKSFDAFDTRKIGSSNDPGFYGNGFYFTPDKSKASGYGENVLACFLNMRNPFIVKNEEMSSASIMFGREPGDPMESYAGDDYESYAGQIREADGVIHCGPSAIRGGEYVEEYVVNNPVNVKSADNNSGEFDPGNPNINS